MPLFPDNRRKRARLGRWCLALLSFGLWNAALHTPGPHPAAARWAATALFGAAGWMLLLRRGRTVPVLNYHSVSEDPGWLGIGRRVSISPAAFERQLAYLHRNGYRTLFISDVHARLSGRVPLSRRVRHVALTFDDGYADNWVAAFPLLKRYRMKATVFVSTDFVSEANPRADLDDRAAGRAEELDWSGYLSWRELAAMRDSGLVEIQSHGRTHARVMAMPRLAGFVTPREPNPWLLWNRRPDSRQRWWIELRRDRSLWGHPVFVQRPALTHRACRPAPGAVRHMLAWSRRQGDGFFERRDCKQALAEEWRRYGARRRLRPVRETEAAYAARVNAELRESKTILEQRLNIPVRALCWPENAYNETTERWAREAGYAVTVANGHDTLNRVGEDPGRITRAFVGQRAFGVASPAADQAAFVLTLKMLEGLYIGYPLLLLAAAGRAVAAMKQRRTPCERDYWSIWG